MLPPTMGYEVGKGREFELEQKAAKNRLLEEARAGQQRERPGLLARALALAARARAALNRRRQGVSKPEAAEQYRGRFAG
jgi:hypothetical protein